MHSHGPACLQGPLTRARNWWKTQRMTSVSDTRKDEPAIRTELVERVRREIAEGTYDTPEKFALALDRLLKRLEEDDSEQ